MSNLKSQIAFALSTLLFGYAIVQTMDINKLQKRVTELEEGWEAHHKWDNKNYYLERSGTALETNTTSDMSLNVPADSFKLGGSIDVDTVTFYSPPTTGEVGIPSWQKKMAKTLAPMQSFLSTVPLYADTSDAYPEDNSITKDYLPAEGTIIRVPTAVDYYVYRNKHWQKVPMNRPVGVPHTKKIDVSIDTSVDLLVDTLLFERLDKDNTHTEINLH